MKNGLALPNYPPPASNGYGSNQKCTYVDEVEYTEKCEEYLDQICYTTYDELCDDIYDQTCRAIVAKNQVRKCFNVTETVCALKEEITYELIDAVFTVQKCSRKHERVCDTLVDLEEDKTQRDECINVPSLVCTTEERTVFEKTCHSETKFDCGSDKSTSVGYDQNSAPSGGYQAGHQPTGYDQAEPASTYGSATGYEQPPKPTSTYDNTGYSTDSYGHSNHYEVTCKKHQEKRCTTTPRTVESQSCETREEKVCDRITESIPKPVDKPHCRNEEKKVCRVEKKTQPKQVKKYAYTQVCRPLVKRICDTADDNRLVPSCIPTTRHVCRAVPSERCEDVPRSHCFSVPTTVKKEKCETIEDSYPAPAYPQPAYPPTDTHSYPPADSHTTSYQ